MATVPDGLLGLAMAMILVRGVIDGRRSLEWELQVIRGLNGDDAGVRRRGIDFVHRVGRHGQEQFISRIEEGFEEDMNRFVDAVGKRNLGGGEPEMRGDHGFDRLALGIAGEVSGGDAGEHIAHRRRTGQGVLVEIEAKGVAAAQRRMIFLHRTHAGARSGLDQGHEVESRVSVTGRPPVQAGANGFGMADEAFRFGEQLGVRAEFAYGLR